MTSMEEETVVWGIKTGKLDALFVPEALDLTSKFVCVCVSMYA